MLRIFIVISAVLFSSNGVAQNLNLLELPIRERPVLIQPVTTPEPEQKPTAIQSSSDFTGGLEINQNALEVGLKSFGAPHIGAREIPVTLWRGSEGTAIQQALSKLQPSRDPALMQLLRDVLLAEAALPEGYDDAEFLYDRVQGLVQLGWLEDARRLIGVAPEITSDLRDILDTLAIYAYDTKGFCPGSASDTVASKKRNIVCLLLEKRYAEAELQTKILQEIAPQVREDGFALLVSVMILQQRTKLPETERIIAPEPINLLLARLAGITPHFHEGYFLSPRVHAMLMDMTTLGMEQRLVHAETAYQASAIGIDDLQRVQFARMFREAERDNINVLLQQFPSATARALLSQVLAESDDPARFAEATLNHGDQHGLYDQMLDTVMAYLPVQPSAALARAHLAVQNFANARDSLPETEDLALWPLMQVLEVHAPEEVSVLDEQDALLESLILDENNNGDPEQDWRNSLAEQPQKRDLILALLPSLGVGTLELNTSKHIPNNPEQYGEELLRATHQLSPANTALNPEQVRTALYILEHLGFGDVAKAYAARRLAGLLASE